MTTHVRIDQHELNSQRKFACGRGPDLPEGDVYFFEGESQAYRHADCGECRAALGWSAEPPRIGTPLSELTYDRFVEIGRSWGYE